MRRIPAWGWALALALTGCGGSSAARPSALVDAGDAAGSEAGVPDAGAPPPDADDAGHATIVTHVDPKTASELVIQGAPATNAGMSDVAIDYPAGAASGVLTYTAVDVTAAGASLRTRIASSSDHGQTWTYVADVNAPEPTTIDSTDPATCPTGTCQGTIVNEVSTVIDDKSDPDASRRWKVLTHRYLWKTGSTTPSYAYGQIALYTAPAPSGPWSTAAPLIGWPSPSSFSSQGALWTTTQLGLSSCLLLTEPSALVVGSKIWLAVGCVASATEIQVELLSSDDHLATLKHVGTLVGPNDATALGATAPRLNAADLFLAGGSPYLLVSPGDAQGNYLGCDLLQLDASGSVVRDAGEPRVLRRLDSPGAVQSGACSFGEGAPATGYVMNIPSASPLDFRVFKTGVGTL